MHDNSFYKVKDTVGNISGDILYVNLSQFSQILLLKLKIYKYLSQALSMAIKIRNKLISLSKFRSVIKKFNKISYSQSGEDLIVRFIFDAINIKNPSYVDIGAHHPYHFSNTALFYNSGSRGINIEPQPELFTDFTKIRKEDINLNLGISDTSGELDFYVMSIPTLNTFSSSEVERYVQEGYSVKYIKKIRVDTINAVIERYCQGIFPDFLSLDAEGLDLKILKSIDYQRSSPTVICVETISFSKTGKGVKDIDIINFLEKQGYMIYGDTYINTIFVKKDKWIQ